MNKYFEHEKRIKRLQEDIDKYLSLVQVLQQKQQELIKTCNHRNRDGSSAITRRNDRGHGHIIYTCEVCGEWGNRTWASKFMDLQ